MIVEITPFDLKQIAESGQCFRMNRIDEEKYSLIAYNRYLELRQIDDKRIELSCDDDTYHKIWEAYFDLAYHYDEIVGQLLQGDDLFLKNAVKFGGGIRILRQEPFEVLVSFIISQNKNIPAIKNCIELLCQHYGECRWDQVTGKAYYTFPTPKTLSMAAPQDLRALKTGYRDKYIIQAARMVEEGVLHLEHLMKLDLNIAVEELKKIPGVGDKVANCVALFGLHHIEAFPVDVWIGRVLNDIYGDQFDVNQYQGYAGIVQQYMFYYMRNNV